MLSRAPSKKLTGPVAKINHEYETWLKSTVYSKANASKLQILAFDVPDKTVALTFGDDNERFQLGFKFWDTYPNDFTQERKDQLLVAGLRQSRATYAVFKVVFNMLKALVAPMPLDTPAPFIFILRHIDNIYTRLVEAQKNASTTANTSSEDDRLAKWQEAIMQGSEVELDDFVYEGPTLDPEDEDLVNRIRDASLDVKPLQEDPPNLGALKKRVLTLLHNTQVALERRKDDIEIHVTEDVTIWNVTFRRFRGTPLEKELQQLPKLFHLPEHILLEITFRDDHPKIPPLFRVVYPRILTMQDVMMGGTLCLGILTSFWNAAKGMDFYIANIYDTFAKNVRVDLKTKQPRYLDQERFASQLQMNPLAMSTRASFKEKFSACSTNVFSRRGREHVSEYGNKLLLPESVLDVISQREDWDFPLTFELITKRGIRTHCGVNMFTAPYRTAVLPQRTLQNLFLTETEEIQLKIVSLPLGISAAFRPKNNSFFDIPDPLGALTEALGSYVALTRGDTVYFKYGNTEFALDVLQTTPGTCIKIIAEPFLELNIHFERALDFEEPRDPLEVPFSGSSEEESD